MPALECPAQHVLRLPGHVAHRAGLVGKEAGTRERIEGLLEERDEFLGRAHHPLLHVLRAQASVGAPDGQQAPTQVDVPLLERAQFPRAQAGQDGGGEDRPLLGRERGEERKHLLRHQDVRDPAHEPLAARDRAPNETDGLELLPPPALSLPGLHLNPKIQFHSLLDQLQDRYFPAPNFPAPPPLDSLNHSR
jgi:hypothetical protein